MKRRPAGVLATGDSEAAPLAPEWGRGSFRFAGSTVSFEINRIRTIFEKMGVATCQ